MFKIKLAKTFLLLFSTIVLSTSCNSNYFDYMDELDKTVELHFKAIKNRDINSLIETVSKNKITLILPNGKYSNSINDYKKVNEEWFNDLNWDIKHKIIERKLNGNIGIVLANINYSDINEKGEPYSFNYFLTLIFERSNSKWELIFDQNTIIKQNAI